MYSFMAQNGIVSYGIIEVVVDFRSDIATLPKDCAPGSSCIVLEDFSIWLFNSKKQWIESA
jgi:hypothetical protein